MSRDGIIMFRFLLVFMVVNIIIMLFEEKCRKWLNVLWLRIMFLL